MVFKVLKEFNGEEVANYFQFNVDKQEVVVVGVVVMNQIMEEEVEEVVGNLRGFRYGIIEEVKA